MATIKERHLASIKRYTSIKTMIEAETPPPPPEAGTIEDLAARVKSQNPTATGAALFINSDFSSSQFGRWTILAIGPDQTYKRIEDLAGSHLHDLPSQWQYPVAYAPID